MALARFAPLTVVAGLLAAVGCNAESQDFDDAFYGDPKLEGATGLDPQPTPEDEDEEEEPAVEPEDDGPIPFARAGSYVGTCTFPDRESFQVDLELDHRGTGFLRRHDFGPFELDAAGMTDAEGISIVEALRDDVVFRVQIYPDTDVIVAECMEMTPTDEGEGDVLGCMFSSIGCLASGNYDIVASGDLALVRKS